MNDRIRPTLEPQTNVSRLSTVGSCRSAAGVPVAPCYCNFKSSARECNRRPHSISAPIATGLLRMMMALLSHRRTCIQASTHIPHASSNIMIGHNTTQPRPALSHVVHRRCCISYSDHLSLSQLSRKSLCRYRDTAQTGKSPTPQLTARNRAHTTPAKHCFSTSISPPRASAASGSQGR